MELNTIHNIDALEGLKRIPDESVQCCVSSPPYWGLRDYKVKGQLGMEKTPEEFIENMVKVFSEVKRVLKKDGVLWINIGDSYNNKSGGYNGKGNISKGTQESIVKRNPLAAAGLKTKDLVGIPWALAFALRADGWYLRADIIWAKKNCMPESVTDRPTRSHEFIFLLSKSAKYYYDHEAIKEPALYDVDGTQTQARKARQNTNNKVQVSQLVNAPRAAGFKDAKAMNGKHKEDKQRGHSRRHNGFNDRWDKMTHEEQCTGMRNKRDVWSIAPAQFPEAHFATFPEEIPDTCILAGSKEGDTILDPFMGAGTTALVARKRNRNFIGFELNPDYIKIAENRLKKQLGMFQ